MTLIPSIPYFTEIGDVETEIEDTFRRELHLRYIPIVWAAVRHSF